MRIFSLYLEHVHILCVHLHGISNKMKWNVGIYIKSNRRVMLFVALIFCNVASKAKKKMLLLDWLFHLQMSFIKKQGKIKDLNFHSKFAINNFKIKWMSSIDWVLRNQLNLKDVVVRILHRSENESNATWELYFLILLFSLHLFFSVCSYNQICGRTR